MEARARRKARYKSLMNDVLIPSVLSLAIAGVAGRMGRQLTAAALDAGLCVTGGSEAPGSVGLKEDIGEMAGRKPLRLRPVTDPVDAATGADIWMDFSQPAATLAALDALKHTQVRAAIIGTTGFDDTGERAIRDAAKQLAIVHAGNFSIGVNVLTALARIASERLGPDWDIEILETHHRHKTDAPSGTALMLGEAAAQGRGAKLSELRAHPYDGPDAKRSEGMIGFSSRRSGGVIGEHEMTFASDKEIITLGHTALERSVFAEGAVRAAIWVADKAPGLYGMDDVLGLSTEA